MFVFVPDHSRGLPILSPVPNCSICSTRELVERSIYSIEIHACIDSSRYHDVVAEELSASEIDVSFDASSLLRRIITSLLLIENHCILRSP